MDAGDDVMYAAWELDKNLGGGHKTDYCGLKEAPPPQIYIQLPETMNVTLSGKKKRREREFF